MLVLKNKPVGIDTVINEINNKVFNTLNWKSTDIDNPIIYNAYHRALKNPRNNSVIPEAYILDIANRKGEYKEVFYDDRLDASSFFYVEDTINAVDNGRIFNTTLSMVFQVDLSKVADSISHRGDTEIQRVVVNAINKSIYGNVSSVITGIPNVYSEFDQSQITFTDMQPFHCFRVDIDVNFSFDCCADGCGLHPLPDNSFLQTVDGGYILQADGFRIIIN